ncbi:MAG: hypothetical protein ACJAS1_000558 [Oleiphilaceae bacterium]|jgi:hypothetical protein
MSNIFRGCSFVFDLTKKQRKFALKVLSYLGDVETDLSCEEAFTRDAENNQEAYLVARGIAFELDNYQPGFVGFCYNEHDDGVAIYSSTSFDTEYAAEFVHQILHYFDRKKSVFFEVARWCDERLDGKFGNMSCFVTKDKKNFHDPSDFNIQRISNTNNAEKLS